MAAISLICGLISMIACIFLAAVAGIFVEKPDVEKFKFAAIGCLMFGISCGALFFMAGVLIR